MVHRHGVPLELDRTNLDRGSHRPHALGACRVTGEFATAEEVARRYSRTFLRPAGVPRGCWQTERHCDDSVSPDVRRGDHVPARWSRR